MPAESSSHQEFPLLRLLAPWRLSLLAAVLCSLFLIQLTAASLPLALLNPAWQLAFIGALLNFAYLPLLALGLLHLAAGIAEPDQRVMRRLKVCARLAIAVSFGFLLLIPIQWLALGQLDDRLDARRERDLSRQERLVSALRQLVNQSRSSTDLFRGLQSLSAPPPPAAYASLAFPVLQQRMQQDLLDAERQLSRQRLQATGGSFWKQVPLASRNTLLLLVNAVGFAALAQRRRSGVPWLLECLKALQGLPRLLRWRRRTGLRSSGQIMASYVEALSRDERT